MLIFLIAVAQRRAAATHSRRWLTLADWLRALELALAGLPVTRT